MTMQRVERIFEFELLTEGKSVVVGGGTSGSARTAVLHFNSAGPCDVMLKQNRPVFQPDPDTGELKVVTVKEIAFLARVDGLKSFEVGMEGDFEVAFETPLGCKPSRLYFRTNSGSVTHRDGGAAEIFTEMFEREALDPKWVEYKAFVDTNARRNEDRLMAAVEARLRQYETTATQKPPEAKPEPSSAPAGSDPVAD